MKLSRLGALLALAASTAAVAVPAAAEDPVPTPCGAVAITDPEGDGVVFTESPADLAGEGKKAPDNTDITAVFFNLTTAADGTKKLTANIRVKNLDKTIPAAYKTGTMEYRINFAAVEDVLGVTAINEKGEFSYTYTHYARPLGGTPSPAQPGAAVDDETTGRLFEGPNGVIQIDMPAELAKAGTKLADLYSGSVEPSTFYADQAPDDGSDSTLSHTITECAAGSAEATATPTATAEATATAAATATADPQQAQPQQAAPQHQSAAPAPPAAAPKPAQPAKKLSCAAKAKKKFKGKKNAKKLKAALKKCKKARK